MGRGGQGHHAGLPAPKSIHAFYITARYEEGLSCCESLWLSFGHPNDFLFWKQESLPPSPCSVAVARSPDSLTQNAWKSLLQSLWLEKSLPSFNL